MTAKAKVAAESAITYVEAKSGSRKLVATKEAMINIISFGSVKVDVQVPDIMELKQRVAQSESVAKRLKTAVARPGVKLHVKATTPMYSADSSDPSLIIKKVGNRVSRGYFTELGVFVKVK